MRRVAAALLGSGLLLLPSPGGAADGAAPWRDPEGLFTIALPEGWATDDSGHMGPGLVAKGPARGGGGQAPIIHITHEPAGIVTLEVRWLTLLGQMRFDYVALQYLSLEEHPEASPPYAQALYSYRLGDEDRVSLTRLALAGGRFFQLTAVAPGEVFADLHPAFLAAFDSFRTPAD